MPGEQILEGEELVRVREMLRRSGYNEREAHPECYRDFSFITFYRLCRGELKC
jgi:hypothetical protein